MRVARLDPNSILIGAREVAKPKPSDIDAGDLPADGSYRWDATRQAFIPLGFGYGKPKRSGVDRDRAVFLLIRAMRDSKPIPQECFDWADWWETHHERPGRR